MVKNVDSFQNGYSPWPGKILAFTKTKSSAKIQYFGYNDFVGSVSAAQLVQLDDASLDAVGQLVHFILRTKCIRDYDQFCKAIRELQIVMGFPDFS